MRNSKVAEEKCWNIVIVDWGELSSGLYFSQVVNKLETVGERLGEIVNFLITKNLIRGSDVVHLIGQSLGAHVTGYASAKMRSLGLSIPKRITGQFYILINLFAFILPEYEINRFS
jgi:hypothetical protein